jgi:hypothetical protein
VIGDFKKGFDLYYENKEHIFKVMMKHHQRVSKSYLLGSDANG